MKLLSIKPSPRANKRFRAVFQLNNSKKIHRDFGQPDAFTFADGATREKRAGYLARHGAAGENWEDPTTPAALSRWILWERPNVLQGMKLFQQRFDL